MAALIETEHLSRSYRLGGVEVPALRDVTVSVPHGQFIAVMGPSGSGKSTFLNLIGCLDRPSGGTYRLDGEDVSRLTADALAAVRSRKLGFVFQGFHLLPRADARANVELPMVYAGLARRARRERAERALARVGLGARMHHRPNELSGGQQQRVAIARAIVNEPVLLLADEPTGALDTRTSLEIMALFQELNRGGLAVLLVTHEPEMARFAERLLRFRDGRLVDDRMQRPESAAAALDALPAADAA
ncbi:ABC transporter ATP-binding protein [Elioraea rosea]|uniref:ABC transporter ATP-binding protein n=1 Tax=Elioraea rosea TaxID=2492390 RepID=UPI0011837DB4|nr:ABC transporter ATP-binding protein [Elioraea rosea]